jgi:hypothetical protein
MGWIYRWIYRLNQQAVREELEPRLAELRGQLAPLARNDCDGAE